MLALPLGRLGGKGYRCGCDGVGLLRLESDFEVRSAGGVAELGCNRGCEGLQFNVRLSALADELKTNCARPTFFWYIRLPSPTSFSSLTVRCSKRASNVRVAILSLYVFAVKKEAITVRLGGIG